MKWILKILPKKMIMEFVKPYLLDALRKLAKRSENDFDDKIVTMFELNYDKLTRLL